MNVKIEYSKYQLEEAVKFVIGRDEELTTANAEELRAHLLHVMNDLADNPQDTSRTIYGILLNVQWYFEGMEGDETFMVVHIWVDPSYGVKVPPTGAEWQTMDHQREVK